MAPEIIEMNGATTTSDVWSVGCTIIELVTGNPPYFELDTMPALFRIVQDDSPPIPDNITPLLRDFLMKCFQKEPLLRSSADQLLKHRWLMSHRKAAKPEPASTKLDAASQQPQDQVKDYNQKLEAKREEMKKVDASKPSVKVAKPKSSRKPPPKPVQEDSESSSDGDWGSDFDITDFKFPGATTDNKQKAPSSPPPAVKLTGNVNNSTTPLVGKPASSDNEEDWDDMGFDEPATPAKPKATTAAKTQPATIPAKTPAKATTSTAKPADDDEEDWDSDLTPKTGVKPALVLNTGAKKAAAGDDDNWDDFGSPSPKASGAPTSGAPVDLARKLASKLKSAWDEKEGEEDIFDVFEDDLDDLDDLDDFNMDEALEKDEVARFTAAAVKSIEGLNSFAQDDAILANCEKIMSIFRDHPNEKSHIISRTGVIPFVEMLHMSNPKIIHSTLKIINLIVEDAAIRESFSVMGGIASTIQYTNRKYSRPIRQEASVFIKQILSAGKKTMQMFVGARGLPVLIDFLSNKDDFVQNKDLFLIGIDCIYEILTSNFQVRIPKNDFCRLFAKHDLLPHLAKAFELVLKDAATKSVYSDKIAEIFVIFSKADTVVKTYFCREDVLKRLLESLASLLKTSRPISLKIVKCFASLSMDSSTHGPLVQVDAIKYLVQCLATHDGQLAMEILQQLYNALYNLCRLNPARQFHAAEEGIIPHLQWVVQENLSLKQFALPILFEMARSKKIRELMKAKEGVPFYLGLLKQQYPWQVQAMDCLAMWLSDDNKVADTIKARLEPLIDVFKTSTTDEVFSRLFELLHTMITTNESLNIALSNSEILDLVIERTNHKNALVRVQLLKILTAFFVAHPKPTELIEKLKDVVSRLQSDPTILVRDMAKALSSKFKKATKREKEREKEASLKKSSHSLHSSSSSSSSATSSSDRKKSSSHLNSHAVTKDKDKKK